MTDALMKHPYAITSELPPEFGYPKAFASGTLNWELTESTTTSTGGGRMADDAVIKLVKELVSYTREDEDLVARQLQLKTIFSNHYDAPHIHFLVNFFLEGTKPGVTKTDSIELLVTNGAPFIPWSILLVHLTQGAATLKSKGKLAPLNLDPSYKNFCLAYVKTQEPLQPPEGEEAKGLRLAKIFDFWGTAMATHNSKAGPKKQVKFTEKDLQCFTGSQFSDSENGTPHLSRKSNEGELRAKLATIMPSIKEKVGKQARIKELRKELLDLTEDSDDEAKAHRQSKKRRSRHDSGSDSDSEQGLSALEGFLKSMMKKIDGSDYIDFASLSTSRLHEIKMLNSSSAKTTRMHAGLSFRQCLSEADVKILSDDLAAIYDGFFFHYLQMVSESRLTTPIKIIFDRIRWWQWVASNFVGNPAAQVMYIKNFVVEYHTAESWEVVAKNSYTLIAKCRDACPITPFLSSKPPQYPTSPSAPPPGHTPRGGKGGKGGVLSPAQVVKLASFKSRFPDICLSRLIRGRTCRHDGKHTTCKYKHVCAWCSSASCRAACSQTEPL